ncbi:MAG: hypothetical protein Harvfovirus15_11 [Harvfovirus sp.]|uniref:Uncharacterized protein n=1 Tax=Harvfovirus sp. TaxID=2487768 RepID=A0A3G5A1H9_9VIRU|nr:MAG: hypothetical protein Harvfovirus15_11 [Harvfovirus sp.]
MDKQPYYWVGFFSLAISIALFVSHKNLETHINSFTSNVPWEIISGSHLEISICGIDCSIYDCLDQVCLLGYVTYQLTYKSQHHQQTLIKNTFYDFDKINPEFSKYYQIINSYNGTKGIGHYDSRDDAFYVTSDALQSLKTTDRNFIIAAIVFLATGLISFLIAIYLSRYPSKKKQEIEMDEF